MAERWAAWLRDLRDSGAGGERFPKLRIDRGRTWSRIIAFDADYSADTFACNLAASPDGTTLVSPTVVVGAFASGSTPITLSLTSVQTANLALIPADDDADGVEDLCFDLLRNSIRIVAGIIPISGKV